MLAITTASTSVVVKGTLKRVDPFVVKGDGAVTVDEDDEGVEDTELACDASEDD